MDALQRHRLHWKCRRGLLELDLVLQRLLREGAEFSAGDLTRLNELLDFPDNDLWDIVIGRSERFAPHLSEMVARLRAA